MKSAIGSLALCCAALLLAVPAAAMSSPVDDPTIASSETNDEIKAHMERGDELYALGELAKAREEYEAAVQLSREIGDLPAKALRRIAYTQYYEGRYQTAGKTLLQLAEEAAEYGDLATQAWAIADAAWVAWRAGDKIDMDRRIARLEKLLGSPYLPGDVKQKIRTKRLGEYSVATH